MPKIAGIDIPKIEEPLKTLFACGACGAVSIQSQKCPSCGTTDRLTYFIVKVA